MTSTQNNEKRKTTYRRLLLVKQLYLHGLSHSQEAGALNKMIAIHSFHNAIEVTLRAIFLQYEIRTEKQLNIDFESMLHEIDDFFKTKGQKLPYRQELRNLNIIRNMVQHHAHEPESAIMDEWRVFSYRFLVRTFREYFNEDFDTISSVKLIEDQRLKQLLELALDRLANDDRVPAVSYAKLAFFLAGRLSGFFPTKRLRSRSIIQSKLRNVKSPDTKVLAREIEDIVEDIDERISNVEYVSMLVSSGVKPADFKRFRSIPLQVSASMNGTPHFSIHGDITEQDARWIHSFVIDSIVKWQLEGFSPGISEQFAPGVDQYITEQRLGTQGHKE